MLVYLKSDMSYTTLGGLRVYGKKFAYGSFGPTDIPVEIYEQKKDILVEAEYTKEFLDKRYGCDFPDVSFKLSGLYEMDLTTLIKIAHCVGVKYHRGRKTTKTERQALCRAIKKIISRGG